MSQRLIGGRQRRILGITASGISVPQIMGAEPDDDKDDDDSNGSGASGSGDNGSSDGVDGGDKVTEDAKTSAILDSEAEKYRARMIAADKRASDFEKKLRGYEDKDKSELEKAQRELQELQAKAEAAEKKLLESRIHNEFLASNKYTWHDPKTALKLLELDDVEVDEDGKVSGLEKAIEALAKSKPFLINGDAGKKKDSGSSGGRPSGSQPPANNSGKDRDKDRAALLKKYPQLSR